MTFWDCVEAFLKACLSVFLEKLILNYLKIAKFAYMCEQVRQKSSIDDFSVLAGSARILLDVLKVGANGSMCALANILGAELIQIYNMFNLNQEKLVDSARLIQNRLESIDYAVI